MHNPRGYSKKDGPLGQAVAISVVLQKKVFIGT